jgi:hypothetical protein
MNSHPVRLNHRKSEFPEKMPLGKINFLNRGMSVLHVQIVDFHLQIIRFPMVQSDLDLELGKLVKKLFLTRLGIILSKMPVHFYATC